jgi:cyclic di-GMP phosphodiesterase
MPPDPPRVLVADDDVSDLLLFRRLLRDTPFAVDTVRSGGQAVAALAARAYAAVITDDERLPDMAGAALLAEAARAHPTALRVLLARSERTSALADAARDGRYQLIIRPFFAQPLTATLARHAVELESSSGRADDTLRTGPTVVEAKAPAGEADADTPAPGRLAHRRLLLTMAELAEAKAGYSSGHGARVSALAGVLGREAGLTGADLEALEDAALIHDVGELSIDPAMLQAERLLDAQERKAVARHAEASHQIARRAGLAPAVLLAVRHHHEHPDGSGYPDGLKGPAIPLAARAIAIADTWDALATDRPYRAAVPLGDCVRMFADLAPSQLDRDLVEIFRSKKLYDLIDWSDPPRPGIKLL